MNDFELAWAATGRAEGGYVNHPNDPGGETNHGITAAVARRYGYGGPMRELPAALAVEIAKAWYWDPLKLDAVAQLSPLIARELFDTNLNLWRGAAGTFLQRSLNALNREGADFADVKVDGQIGAATVSALEDFLDFRGKDGELVLLRCLNGLQLADYVRQAETTPGKEAFFFGWVRNRVVL